MRWKVDQKRGLAEGSTPESAGTAGGDGMPVPVTPVQSGSRKRTTPLKPVIYTLEATHFLALETGFVPCFATSDANFEVYKLDQEDKKIIKYY